MEQQKRIIVAIAATWPGLIESRQRVGDCFPLARAPRSERDGRTKRENKRERERRTSVVLRDAEFFVNERRRGEKRERGNGREWSGKEREREREVAGC